MIGSQNVSVVLGGDAPPKQRPRKFGVTSSMNSKELFLLDMAKVLLEGILANRVTIEEDCCGIAALAKAIIRCCRTSS